MHFLYQNFFWTEKPYHPSTVDESDCKEANLSAIKSKHEYFESTFSRVDLSECVVQNSKFEDCDFDNCNFSGASFIKCKFNNCTFNHCNLNITEIIDSRLYEVNFNECKLSGIDWTKANWTSFNLDYELKFSRSILTNSSFMGLKLQGIIMDECKVVDVDFRECDLSKGVFSGCDLHGSLFNKTILRSANFTESWDYNIDVLNNYVDKAKFSRAEAVSLLEGLGIELED